MIARPEVAELIASIRAAGGSIRRDGDVIELAAPKPLAPDLVARVRAAKPALLAVLDNAPDWQPRHWEALAYWLVLHSPDEAAQLAWGEMENRWHRLHGRRFPVTQCAGCGGVIRNGQILDLIDGGRVHFDDLGCLTRYGVRWRADATRALVAMGLAPPQDKDQ